ncbi:unnamed protein product [Euphydryas editha]|uniref:Strictosidine synthase conserved region domain-containing protein n=1 Tax=Euphydryas editha TaxID=104508 RepID=A0AAU9U8V2_EUPED|nr:unnamed protein product [Euphydryas editha]
MGYLLVLIKKILKLILYLAIVIAIILFIPNLPPYTKFTSIEIEPTQPLIGELAINGLLNNAEHLFEDKLLGPECYQIYNDEVYTGLATGEIVKISPGGHVTFVTKIGEPCTGLIQEHICGRPLGFVIDNKNKVMYVADAYYGIWKVNLETYQKQILVSPRVPVNGKVPMLFNSVALAQNGDIYWTDSSSDYHLKDGVTGIMCDPTGRLLHYNSAKNESQVLLDNLYFSNGLVISPDNQFVLVAETAKYRLIKYYLSGPKKGKSEVFVAGLPGYPDNLRTLPDGSGILISLYNVFDENNPMIIKTLASAPLARKFIARTFHLIENTFDFLNKQFHHHIFEEIVYYVGSFSSTTFLNPGKSGLIQMDWNGKIVASYYNTDGSIHHLSDAIVFKDKLYTGSPHQNFIGVVPAPPLLKKAFSTNKLAIEESPKAEVKPLKQVKPKLEDKKEIPKQQQSKENIKLQTVKKESTVNKNEMSGDSGIKPKVSPKEAEVKPKVVAKEVKSKPQVAANEPEIKPKVAAKETESKPKVVTNDAKKEQVVVSKEQIKQQDPDKNPKSTPKKNEENAKVISKSQDVKRNNIDKEPSANEINPSNKDTETKFKSSKSKESEQTKPVPNKVQVNSKTKSEHPQNKAENLKLKKQNSEESPKKGHEDSKSTKNSPKPIPIEEEIPSDTAKPNKKTLKVIKKSGPQEIPNPNL